MIKNFFKHNLIYTISTIMTRGMSFILLPILTNYLSPHDYGAIDLITITGTFVLIVFGLESYQGIARHIPECITIKDKQHLFSNAIYFLCCSYLILLILTNTFTPFLASFAIPMHSKLLFNIVVLAYFFQAIIVNCQALLRYDMQIKKSVIASSATSLALLISNIIFVAWLKLGIVGAIYAILLGNIGGAITAIIYTKNYISNMRIIDLQLIKKLLNFTYPLAISAIFTIIMLYIDRIALSKLMSLTEVGLFGVGFRIASIVTLIMAGTQAALGPLIYQNYKNADTPGKLVNLFEKFIIIACIFVLGINLFATELLYIFAGKSYLLASNVIKILAPAIILSQLYIFFPGMNINKKTHLILYINIMGALINIILNYVFITHIGLIGAALATLCSYMIFVIIFIRFSQRNYFIPIQYKHIIVNMMLLICGIIINQIAFKIMNWQQIIGKIILFMVFIVIAMKINKIRLLSKF